MCIPDCKSKIEWESEKDHINKHKKNIKKKNVIFSLFTLYIDDFFVELIWIRSFFSVESVFFGEHVLICNKKYNWHRKESLKIFQINTDFYFHMNEAEAWAGVLLTNR